MAVARLNLKENFRPAQPVSASWYNTIAKAVKKMYPGESQLRELPGFDAGATQALMNINGTIQWVTVEECA